MIPINDREIEALIRLMRNQNIFPVDMDRYAGGDPSDPISKSIKRCVDEIVELTQALSSEELVNHLKGLPPIYRSFINTDGVGHREPVSLRQFALYFLVGECNRRYLNMREHVVSGRFQESVVFDRLPRLAALHDHEGLIPIDTPGVRFSWGGAAYNSCGLYYHQCFRRYFTSNINRDIIIALLMFREQNPKCRVAIALDHTRLVEAGKPETVLELDRWFGPNFDWCDLDDPHAVGLTVYGRGSDHPLADIDPIDRTEIFWSYRDGLKTLQIEEIHSVDKTVDPNSGLYVNRYVHAIRDTRKRCFIHLDGAVKVYEGSSYRKRYSTRMPDEARAEHKPKLFRIDGEIPQEAWSEIIVYFFRQNEMVLEYFNTPSASE